MSPVVDLRSVLKIANGANFDITKITGASRLIR